MASLWIIDAYNFIRQSRRFSGLEAEHVAKGREAALRWLGEFSGQTGERVCVVFDAYSGLHRDPIASHPHGLTVLSSRGGYTADEEIISLAQAKGQSCVVVSSDRAILDAAVEAGASILKSDEFEREVAKILEGPGDSEEEAARDHRRPAKGNAFRPPKEKKKALALLRKYQ